MKRLFIAPLLVIATINTGQASEPTQTEQARALVKSFAGELQPRLKTALQTGGPAHAIEVCAEQAPAIAAKLSDSSGWTVKRVSLKPRNVANAIPDDWERAVLIGFDKALAEGKPAAGMSYSATENGQFRYMQAQPVGAVCLTCHGENLAPEVKAALEKYAPGDTATGYRLGQIRGAFSLSTKAIEL